MPNLNINGRSMSVDAANDVPLLWAIRDTLGLTGTKFGCGIAACGACTVHLNGRAVRSCSLPVSAVDGASITTIEGVASGAALHAIQESFLECGGAQCGICTPGMVLAACDLLSRNPEPTEADVRVALAGNLCRCTGYMRIFVSVLDACRKLPRITGPSA